MVKIQRQKMIFSCQIKSGWMTACTNYCKYSTLSNSLYNSSGSSSWTLIPLKTNTTRKTRRPFSSKPTALLPIDTSSILYHMETTSPYHMDPFTLVHLGFPLPNRLTDISYRKLCMSVVFNFIEPWNWSTSNHHLGALEFFVVNPILSNSVILCRLESSK